LIEKAIRPPDGSLSRWRVPDGSSLLHDEHPVGDLDLESRCGMTIAALGPLKAHA